MCYCPALAGAATSGVWWLEGVGGVNAGAFAAKGRAVNSCRHRGGRSGAAVSTSMPPALPAPCSCVRTCGCCLLVSTVLPRVFRCVSFVKGYLLACMLQVRVLDQQMDHRAKKARQTHCFAPNCTSGYVSSRKSGERVSLFSVPKDPERFEAWRRAVPRADKALDENSALCELHFDEQYIVRHFTHVINEATVKIPRDRPVLTSDAVPTIYPNAPSYLSKKAPQKRQSKTSTCGLPSKLQRCEMGACSQGVETANDEGSVSDQQVLASEFCVQRCELPSVYWSRHQIAGSDNVTAFTVCALEDHNLYFEKVVLVMSDSSAIQATVFVQATQVRSVEITDAKMIEDLLLEVDSLIPCKGFGKKESSKPTPSTERRPVG